MKKLILILSTVLLFSNCSNDNQTKQENLFLGSWKLLGVSGGGFGNDNYSLEFGFESIPDGYTISFKSNGTFNSNRFAECTEGRYTYTNNELTLDYNCVGFTLGFENPEGTFIEEYYFEDEFLLFNPKYYSCAEGCTFKFKKVEEQPFTP